MIKRKPAAFTLVEMLVVISIIGILMAIITPATQQALEMSRNTACRNKIRQLAIAGTRYSLDKGEYPGYVSDIGIDTTKNEVSWVVPMFPYMGVSDNLWEAWKAGSNDDSAEVKATRTIYIDMLVCPSDRPEGFRVDDLSYVINAGKVDFNKDSGNKANGIAHNRVTGSFELEVSPEYVSGADGATYTLMLAENIQAGKWSLGNLVGDNAWQNEKYVAFVWHDEQRNPAAGCDPAHDDYSDGIAGGCRAFDARQCNGEKHVTTFPEKRESHLGDLIAEPTDWARPSSHHGQGANVAFCDTRVIFLSERIEYDVYTQLMTSDHKFSDALNKTSILDDRDFMN